ncbi:MAG: hypothetical protein KGK07_06285 [Chloroflexota bacterium]|nr:hypothetical protein [Chloroflexota bacterium]
MSGVLRNTGVTDQPAGAGVQEFLGLADPRYAAGGIVQAVTDLAIGDAITLHGGSSFTPPVVGATAPGMIVLAWRPPPDKLLIVDDAQFLSQIASATYCRIGKRHFLYGRNNVAAPGAPAAPTVAVAASVVGMDLAAYTYKVAPVNAIGQEGPVSPASAIATTTAGNRRVNVTPPALPTGAVGWAIYRSLQGQTGGPWYWLTFTRYGTAFPDVNPDSALDATLVPANTWAIADAPNVDVCAGGSGELQLETMIAMSAAPANVIYKEARGRWRSAPLSPGLAVGRTRSQLYGAGDSFAAAALNTMFQRGSQLAQSDRTYDFNVAAIAGFDGPGTGGAFVVWGAHLWAASELTVAGIASLYPFAGLKRPLIVGPNAEVYAEVGNSATAAAGLRQVTINGRLIPIAAS